MTLSVPTRLIPELVTVEVLAERWHLKPGTIRAWARRGQIPSRKMGRLLVFDARELEEWYRSLPSGATPEPPGCSVNENPD